MPLQSKQTLRKKLEDPRYLDAFITSRIGQTIAMQLRILRQRENLSQRDLAKRLGTSQNAISRMENPGYGKQNVSNLRRAALFFKVGLIVRFAPLSEIFNWGANLSEAEVNVPRLEDDTGFIEHPGPIGDQGATGNVLMTGTGGGNAGLAPPTATRKGPAKSLHS